MNPTFSLFLLLLAFSHLQAQSDIPLPPLITITGYGEVKVRPDEVEISLGIHLRDETADMLSKLIDKRSSAVIKILRDANVTDQDIMTSGLSIQPYYADTSSSSGNNKPDYYNGEKSITFTLKNISNYDAIMTKIYDAGINTSLVFSFQRLERMIFYSFFIIFWSCKKKFVCQLSDIFEEKIIPRTSFLKEGWKK